MGKMTSSVMKGLATGAVVGTAAYMLSSPKKTKAKAIKKSTVKAVKNVSSLMDSVAEIMK